MLGALQWPSIQASPQLGATVSLLSGQITAATTEDLRDANKALNFAQMNNDVGLQFRPVGKISDMVLVAMSDASWGNVVKGTAKVDTFSCLLRQKSWMVKPPIISSWIGEVFVYPEFPEAEAH